MEIRCLIDGVSFTRRCDLSRYLKKVYNMDVRTYVIDFMCNGSVPSCECGCGQPVLIQNYTINRFVRGHSGGGCWQHTYDEYKKTLTKTKLSKSVSDSTTGVKKSDEHKKNISSGRTKWINDNPEKFKSGVDRMIETKNKQSLNGDLSKKHYTNTRSKDYVETIYRKIGEKSSKTKRFKFKNGMFVWNKGKTFANDNRIISGVKHYKFNPNKISVYTKKFYDPAYRNFILEQTGGECFTCSNTTKLCLHHINENKKDDRDVNLIFVCRSCHSKIHNNHKFKFDFNDMVSIFKKTIQGDSSGIFR